MENGLDELPSFTRRFFAGFYKGPLGFQENGKVKLLEPFVRKN
jgi:hypothetical protein